MKFRFKMEYEAEHRLFTTPAERNRFCRGVIESFDAANSHVELISLYQEHEMQIRQMEKGDDFDRIAAEELSKRYFAAHERVEAGRQWVYL